MCNAPPRQSVIRSTGTSRIQPSQPTSISLNTAPSTASTANHPFTRTGLIPRALFLAIHGHHQQANVPSRRWIQEGSFDGARWCFSLSFRVTVNLEKNHFTKKPSASLWPSRCVQILSTGLIDCRSLGIFVKLFDLNWIWHMRFSLRAAGKKSQHIWHTSCQRWNRSDRYIDESHMDRWRGGFTRGQQFRA